jgi:hypothetical protein
MRFGNIFNTSCEFRKTAWLVVTIASLGCVPSLVFAANEQACKRYATEAVRQNQQNLQLQAGFKPPVWSSDFRGHYNWCLQGTNVKSTPGHLASREKTLQEYSIKKEGKEAAAKRYASEAVRQYNQSKAMGTGFKPPVWSSDFNGHYNWSRHGGNVGSTPGHLASREKTLQEFAIQHNKGPLVESNGESGFKMIPIENPVFFPPPPKEAVQKQPDAGGIKAAPMLSKIDKTALAKVVNPSANIEKAILLINQKLKLNKELSPIEDPVFDIPVGKDKGKTAALGMGFNSLLMTPTVPAVEIPVNTILDNPMNQISGSSAIVRSMEDYYDHVGVDVSVSGSYLGFSGSNRTSFESNSALNRYSDNFIGYRHVLTNEQITTLNDVKLNPTALNVLKTKGVNAFYQQYGDSFVYRILYGAEVKATGAYSRLKEEEHLKFSNDTKASGDWLIGGFDVSVHVENESRRKHEKENINMKWDSYGPAINTPDDIESARDVVSRFPIEAAKQPTKAVERYTLMKYSSLPDFIAIAGVDALNLKEQRKILSKLIYYKHRFSFMRNNMEYIDKHPREFKAGDVQKSRQHKSKVNQLLFLVNNDIGIIQRYPFDKSKWNIDLNQYKNVPDYAPDTRFVHVKVEFPVKQRHLNQMDGNKINWERELVGPWVGPELVKHVKGDDDIKGDPTDINMHSKLIATSDGKEAYIDVDFIIKEASPDWTTFQGSRRRTVYKAPENYKIVSFKKSKEDYYLRGMTGIQGMTVQDIHYLLDKPGYKQHFKNGPIKDPIWPDLSFVVDTTGGDYEVGFWGTLEFDVELKPVE